MRKIIIAFATLLLITKTFGKDTVSVKKVMSVKKINTNLSDLNDKSLYREIKNQGILYPDIAFSQALFESDHFRSHIAKRNRNLFGMVVSSRRKNVSIGRKNKYAVYITWMSSVEDYKMWQDNVPTKSKVSKEAYYRYVQKVYSHDRSYIKSVKKIVKYYKRIFIDTV